MPETGFDRATLTGLAPARRDDPVACGECDKNDSARPGRFDRASKTAPRPLFGTCVLPIYLE